MSGKMKWKIAVDILMTLALLVLMSYGMAGEAVHEWTGMGMFVLFILHHILNRSWTANLGKGRYTSFRILQTILALLILVCMLGSMVSGILLSRYVFAFLHISGFAAAARTVHMLGAYWGFVLMSLHLGLHWNMVVNMAGKKGTPSAVRTWTARILALAVAAYGIWAFVKRGIRTYMLLQVHFVFLDYAEPLALFILDYMAIMGFFVFAGYYAGKALRRAGSRKK